MTGPANEDPGPSRPPLFGIGRDELILVGLFTALAAMLRFVDLGSQGLWYDEAWTRDITVAPLSRMARMIPVTESTPPAYYVLNWITWRVAGGSQFALRSVAALAGTLTVPAVWAAGRLLVSRRAGLIAALACAVSPLMWWYSQEARAYSLAALLCATALIPFALALRSPRRGVLIGWGVLSAAAIMTQYVAVLPVAVMALILLNGLRRSRRLVLASVALPAAAGLLLVPLAAYQRGTGHTDWVSHLAIGVRLVQIPAQAWVGNAIARSHTELIAGASVGCLVALGLALLGRRAPLGERAGIGQAALIAFGPLAGLLIAALIGWDLLIARNLLVAWPAAAIAAAGCLSVLRPRLAWGVMVVFAVAMVLLIVRVGSDPALQRIDWRPVTRLLGPVPPGGRVIALQPYGNKRPFSVYADRVDYIPVQGVRTTELDVVSSQLPQPRICWWGGVCADGILVDYDTLPSPVRTVSGLRRIAVRREGHFTVVVYRSKEPRLLTVDSVRAAFPPGLIGGVLEQRGRN